MYNTYTIKQADNKINPDSNSYVSETAKSQNTQSNSSGGQWVKVNESMSETSKKYQSQITGHTDEVWLQNGVLIDAKGHYKQFINKNTGQFYDWFQGKNSFINQARNQLYASEGQKIKWYFMEQDTLNAVKKLFDLNGIGEIDLIYEMLGKNNIKWRYKNEWILSSILEKYK